MTEPQLIERQCGGWLAIAPPDSPVAIAVVGADEPATRAGLAASLSRWNELLAQAAANDNA